MPWRPATRSDDFRQERPREAVLDPRSFNTGCANLLGRPNPDLPGGKWIAVLASQFLGFTNPR